MEMETEMETSTMPIHCWMQNSLEMHCCVTSRRVRVKFKLNAAVLMNRSVFKFQKWKMKNQETTKKIRSSALTVSCSANQPTNRANHSKHNNQTSQPASS